MEDLRNSAEQFESFADLQDMMLDVLGGKAQDIILVANSQSVTNTTNESGIFAKKIANARCSC